MFEPCCCHIIEGLFLEISEILRARDCGLMWVRMTMKPAGICHILLKAACISAVFQRHC